MYKAKRIGPIPLIRTDHGPKQWAANNFNSVDFDLALGSMYTSLHNKTSNEHNYMHWMANGKGFAASLSVGLGIPLIPGSEFRSDKVMLEVSGTVAWTAGLLNAFPYVAQPTNKALDNTYTAPRNVAAKWSPIPGYNVHGAGKVNTINTSLILQRSPTAADLDKVIIVGWCLTCGSNAVTTDMSVSMYARIHHEDEDVYDPAR